MLGRRSLVAGAGAALLGARAARARQATPVAGEQLAGMAKDPEWLLTEGGIEAIVAAAAAGEVTADAITAAAEARIARYDATYGAVIELNPDGEEIAAALDARGEAVPVGPLHGVPVLLKDIIATGDRMRTTAGSLALANTPVAEDATIARRLRAAGAVLLGKANLTEWSNVRYANQTAGWSDRGGQTRNPYNPAMSPWGSSSGSAAAVALGYAPAALGSETNGSIICPAAACGVVGLKPTVGLVSRVGVMPVTLSMDSPGPITRTVRDAAVMLNVLAGYDHQDPAYGVFRWAAPVSTAANGFVHAYDAVDYTAGLEPGALRGARLGISWGLWGMDPEADAVAYDVVDQLRAAGAEVIEDVRIPSLPELAAEAGVGVIVNSELSAGMRAFFARFMPEGPVRSLEDVVAWNGAHADVAMVRGGQEWLVAALSGVPLDDPAYVGMLQWLIAAARTEGLDVALDDWGLDALIAPTAGVPTPIPPEGGTSFSGSSALASSFAGYPSITVPMGQVRGLPVGLHLMGRPFGEQELLRLAYGVEELLGVATAPPLQRERWETPDW